MIYKFAESGPDRLAPPVPGGTMCGMYPYAWRNGELRPHAGIDLCAPLGTPIIAPRAGVVVAKTVTEHGGNNFTIDHGGVVSYYAHCQYIYVNVGDRVAKHQVVATVGATGVLGSGGSMTPHLHMQVMATKDFSSTHYDPSDFLGQLGIEMRHGVNYWKDNFPKSTGSGAIWLAVGATVVLGSFWIWKRRR